MKRWVHEQVIDAMQPRLDDNPDITVLRRQTVEHPFDTIKMWLGATFNNDSYCASNPTVN